MTACLVCGCGAGLTDRLDGLLRRCPDCTFTWTAQPMAASTDLYDASYFAGGGYEEYFLPGPRRFEAGVRLRWLHRTVRPRSLVEAGAAGGFFVEAAQRAGIAASGVELCREVARRARREVRVPVRYGAFEDFPLAEPVDAVCAFHVLEHVEDPHAFLRAARRALGPTGVVALEVPNVDAPAARRLGLDWPGLQPRYHRWHFTPGSLAQLVTRHGFRILRQDTTVFRRYMPWWYRTRRAQSLLLPDVRHLRTVRLTHPTRGELIRVIAQRTGGV